MSTGAAPDRIGPDDPRYRAVVDKRFNKRFSATPGLRPARRARPIDVVSAVAGSRAGRTAPRRDERRALPGGIRLGSRGPGDRRRLADEAHRPTTRRRGAVAVEAGATVGETFRALVRQAGASCSRSANTRGSAWAGTWSAAPSASSAASSASPRTTCMPSRSSPWTRAGGARIVVATRETSDPNRELWWAHTGGGGGNFGIVTRYWFRSPGASGDDPAALLPRAPESITTFKAEWSWSDIDRPSFLRLLRNHGDLVRAEQRRRFARTPRSGRCSSAPSQAVREDHRPRREHGRRRRRAAGGRLSGGAGRGDPSRQAAASWHGCPGSSSR